MSELRITLAVFLISISSVSARLPCGGFENIYVCKEGEPSTFLICTYGYEYEFQCPPGLHFNAKMSICDWPGRASCELDDEVLEEAQHMQLYDDDNNYHIQTSSWWPRQRTTTSSWWTQPTTTRPTTQRWWRRPRPTTQSWYQEEWKPPKTTPKPTKKPRHGQLTDNGWRTKRTTSGYDHRLIRGPSDPWAPITTAAVVPTQKQWQIRSTPRTSQVSWKERNGVEQNGIVVKTNTPKPGKVPVREKEVVKKEEETCPKDKCKLPSCRCPGSDIPGSLSVKEVPQMIMLSFDDKVNEENVQYFEKLFTKDRINPNGCPIKATFFVSKVGTDFAKVKELYNSGHEIASHSKSYRLPHSWWASASYEDYKAEIEGMRRELVKKADIPYKDIKGMRVPFLQIGGDNQYKVLQDYNYFYDSSMVTGHLLRDKRPPVWPFTLDYPVNCKYSSVEPRPKESYPGLWEVPITRLYGNDGRACSMADSCVPTKTSKMALKYLRDNFLRHYTKNRAPLGLFVHASWFKQEPHALEALQDFIKKLTQLRNVWFVTVSQVVEWTRQPTPISQLQDFKPFQCKTAS